MKHLKKSFFLVVYSDTFNTYKKIDKKDYTHKTVNHMNF